jgi:hypothetical protein
MVVSLVSKVTSPLLHYRGGTTFGRASSRELIATECPTLELGDPLDDADHDGSHERQVDRDDGVGQHGNSPDRRRP